MPLPSDSFAVTGGCNCGAIRYRIDVPPLDERPVNPTSPDGSVRFPFIMADHCNDCRRSLAMVLPVWLQTPRSMMTVRLAALDTPPVPLDRPSSDPLLSSSGDGDKGVVGPSSGPWLPADEVLAPREAPPPSPSSSSSSSTSWLRFFKSSPDVTRAFCGRCGVHVSYARNSTPNSAWPELFDVNLGSVDKEFLEKGWMAPERHLFWDWGIGWVKDWTRGTIPAHSDWRAM